MRKRVQWNPSPTQEVVFHRFYWALDKSVDYYSDFVEVVGDTELILPDDIPCFPLVSGLLEIGITAVDQAGNESDMTRRRIFVDFAPPKPRQVSLRNIVQYPYDIRI